MDGPSFALFLKHHCFSVVILPFVNGPIHPIKLTWYQASKRVKIIHMDLKGGVCQRLVQVQGVGPLTATALVAAVGNAKIFKSGRQMAAWLGLVPRQCSSGGKQILLGISKRGDRYLRSLLIHGARAVVKQANHKLDAMSGWIRGLKERRGYNKACVAVANKNARILWALMAHDACYQAK
jgi:transposase